MFIAHLPAGYISSTLLFPRVQFSGVSAKVFAACAAVGAIAPDLDMFYFYLVDHGKRHHHNYVTHFPILWVTLLAISLIWFRYGRSRSLAALAAIFSFNGLIHMVLDTAVGSIKWLAPFVDRYFSFFTVPALHWPWWLNFMLHWTFSLEIGILGWAILLWRRNANIKAIQA